MKNIKFAHIADAHIGYQQYGLETRRQDFYIAWRSCIDKIVEEKVQFVVIAGDTFHHRKPDYSDIIRVKQDLELLNNLGIYTYGVYGNHDAPSQSDKSSWLSLLDHYIYEVNTIDNPPVSVPHEQKIAITGIPWVGNRISEALTIVRDKLDKLAQEPDYSILITHLGVKGLRHQQAGYVDVNELLPFMKLVDYVAAGHLHQPHNLENIVHYPGSLEACSSVEFAYKNKGMNIVTVKGEVQTIEKFIPTQRSSANITILLNSDSIGSLTELVMQKLSLIKPQSIINISLTGMLDKKIGRQIIADLISFVRERTNPLHLDIKDKTELQPDEVPQKRTNQEHLAVNDIFGPELARLARRVMSVADDSHEVIKLIGEHYAA